MTLGGSVGGERAGEHLHQGRLAGRVTTEVGVAASYARR